MKKCITVFLIVPLFMMCSGQQKDPGKEKLKPTLSSIQANVFDKNCTSPGCHGGLQPQDELYLEDGQSYRNLVNVPSIQIQDLLLVNPGEPDSSYLLDKLEGLKLVGERMPMGDSELPAEDIQAIREWIKQGAPDN